MTVEEFIENNKFLMGAFDDIITIERGVLDLMHIAKDAEQLEQISNVASSCEEVAKKILNQADNTATKMAKSLAVEAP